MGLLITTMGASAPPQMVFIPVGSYLPLYTTNNQAIPVKSFYLDRYPVTNQDFHAFLKYHPQWWRSRIKPIFAEKNSRIKFGRA